MNIVQHNRDTVTRHTVVMDGPVSRRDAHDFLFQVEQVFEEAKGRPASYDDDYYVTGDEDGLRATFETKKATS